MTQPHSTRRCRWCGRPFDVVAGPGRPKEFCKAGCRQADYGARQRSADVGLTEAELIVTRTALEDLRDRLYVLEAAIEDVDRDLVEDSSPQASYDALHWLLAAARPLANAAINLT